MIKLGFPKILMESLVVIVFIIVLKNELDSFYGTVGFILFAMILFIAAKWYKKIRKSN